MNLVLLVNENSLVQTSKSIPLFNVCNMCCWATALAFLFQQFYIIFYLLIFSNSLYIFFLFSYFLLFLFMSCSLSQKFQNYLQSLFANTPTLLPPCNYYSNDEFLIAYNGLENHSESLSVFHLNIRSLNSNSSKLFQLLSVLKFSFKIIVLS